MRTVSFYIICIIFLFIWNEAPFCKTGISSIDDRLLCEKMVFLKNNFYIALSPKQQSIKI